MANSRARSEHDLVSNNSPSSGMGLPGGTTIHVGNPKLGALVSNDGPPTFREQATRSPPINAEPPAQHAIHWRGRSSRPPRH